MGSSAGGAGHPERPPPMGQSQSLGDGRCPAAQRILSCFPAGYQGSESTCVCRWARGLGDQEA